MKGRTWQDDLVSAVDLGFANKGWRVRLKSRQEDIINVGPLPTDIATHGVAPSSIVTLLWDTAVTSATEERIPHFLVNKLSKFIIIIMSVLLETSLGDIVIDLFTDEAPCTCFNFLKLCQMKFYNSSLFHAV